MRQYIDIINEAAAKVQVEPFVLAPGLDPNNYQLTDSMRDFKSWKAMTYEGDSRIKKGEFGPVGYIWISLKDNTIIPISRGDEHHEGGDVIYDLINSNQLRIGSPKEYVPIFSYGDNYIYYKEDIPKYLNVLAKFLSWGGMDGTLKGANDMRKMSMSNSQFVASKGDITIQPGHLAPLGKSFYDHYKTLQTAIIQAREATARSAQMRPFKVAADVLKFLSGHTYALNISPTVVKQQIAAVRALAKENDLQGLSDLFYGFGSMKRKIHEELRQHDPKAWTGDTQVAFWGDVPLAVNMLMDL
ncbi:MAG: hypothetical protein EOO77_35140 [Oxalobacteraceae bacterium]|nr:MAG: hypothetical protein EOO77_35140 [Oxalobacteraceae bacterium]